MVEAKINARAKLCTIGNALTKQITFKMTVIFYCHMLLLQVLLSKTIYESQ